MDRRAQACDIHTPVDDPHVDRWNGNVSVQLWLTSFRVEKRRGCVRKASKASYCGKALLVVGDGWCALLC